MSEVVRGYQHVASAPPCPYCGDKTFMFEDDGAEDTLRVRCWCGATARVRKDDPDLEALVVAEADIYGENRTRPTGLL